MNEPKVLLFRLTGLILSVLPVLICVLTYFPVWSERGSRAVISGFTLLLIFIAVLPLTRMITQYLRSPSAYMIWLAIFLFFLAVAEIAHEMTVISFVGFLGNLLGSVFFRLARKCEGQSSEGGEK